MELPRFANRIASMSAAGLAVVLLTGCGWGDLGEPVSAGPYRFRPPSRFRPEKKAAQMIGQNAIAYTGPGWGGQAPGIVLVYAPQPAHLDEEPPWDRMIRDSLMAMTGYSGLRHTTGPVTTVNNLRGMRFEFTGTFAHKGKDYPAAGVGYWLGDGTNLLWAVGVSFGSGAESNIAKLDESLKTIERPGLASPPSWAGRSSGAGPLARGDVGNALGGAPGGYPSGGGMSVPGGGMGRPPGFPPAGMGMGMGRGGYPGSPAGAMGSGEQTVDPAESARRAEEARRLAEERRRLDELAAAAREAGKPEYYQANLELLRQGDDSQKSDVLERLGGVSPSDVSDAELRKQFALAIRDVAEDERVRVDVRRQAVEEVVHWTGNYSIPVLIGLLEDEQRFIQLDALGHLTGMPDERAIEPVTRLFVEDPTLRDKAADCLRLFGAAAEDKVLELSRPSDVSLTRATVQLLGDIGTRKSLPPFNLLRQLDFYALVKKDINIATAKIREREKASENEK